ncbi:NUDIX domain-containing protein [Alphaproteobacteria bacterium]|nr:NUDIX domain-containing protein [Alphaproteobacteria bacterium]
MSFEITSNFLEDQSSLMPQDAVAGIIVNQYNQTLLQLRDDKLGIFFPNHWGLFGGAMEKGESPKEALVRELKEELTIDFCFASIKKFVNVELGFAVNKALIKRYFYIVPTCADECQTLKVNEGLEARFFSWEDALKIPNFTPYDRFAVWAYCNQSRI